MKSSCEAAFFRDPCRLRFFHGLSCESRKRGRDAKGARRSGGDMLCLMGWRVRRSEIYLAKVAIWQKHMAKQEEGCGGVTVVSRLLQFKSPQHILAKFREETQRSVPLSMRSRRKAKHAKPLPNVYGFYICRVLPRIHRQMYCVELGC